MARGHTARHAAVALGIGLALAVAGASAVAGSSATMPTSPAAPQKTRLPMKTIGVMGPVDAAEIIKLSTDATVLAARALGWKTTRVDPGGDPAKMAAGMTSLVNARVDAIVLTTIEPATIASGLRAAKARNIPVIDTHTLTQSSSPASTSSRPAPSSTSSSPE
jgi:ABC-type sugar transport system substrate-binding protein